MGGKNTTKSQHVNKKLSAHVRLDSGLHEQLCLLRNKPGKTFKGLVEEALTSTAHIEINKGKVRWVE